MDDLSLYCWSYLAGYIRCFWTGFVSGFEKKTVCPSHYRMRGKWLKKRMRRLKRKRRMMRAKAR